VVVYLSDSKKLELEYNMACVQREVESCHNPQPLFIYRLSASHRAAIFHPYSLFSPRSSLCISLAATAARVPDLRTTMPKSKIDISKLSLNLDGCRFGDGLQNLRQPHESPSPKQQSIERTNREDENHDLESHYINNEKIVNKHRHNPEPEILSPLGTTYRSQELSIGNNFLRFKGSTFASCASSKDELEVLECIGRGGFSSVWKARRITDEEEKYYALKLFCMQSNEKRRMLLRELKLLCTAAGSNSDIIGGDGGVFGGNGGCECLVQLEGAFFDSDQGAVTLVSNFYCSRLCVLILLAELCSIVIQVLEFMDRGSISDLLNCNSTGLPTSPLFRGLSPHTSYRSVKLPEYAIAAIAYQMMWGLGFLHFQSVLHRDIKVCFTSADFY
jgi:hypothetical protein